MTPRISSVFHRQKKSTFRWFLHHQEGISGPENGGILKLIYKASLGDGFSLTEALHTAYIGEYLHFRYLEMLADYNFNWNSGL